MSTEMTPQEARTIWNNLNEMSQDDFGGEYPIEVIEQACEAAVVLGLMYKTIDDEGEPCYGLTDRGTKRADEIERRNDN